MPQMIKKTEIEQYIGHVCEPTPWFEVTQEPVSYTHLTLPTNREV